MASVGEPVPWTNEDEGFIDRYVFPDSDLPPIEIDAGSGCGSRGWKFATWKACGSIMP